MASIESLLGVTPGTLQQAFGEKAQRIRPSFVPVSPRSARRAVPCERTRVKMAEGAALFRPTCYLLLCVKRKILFAVEKAMTHTANIDATKTYRIHIVGLKLNAQGIRSARQFMPEIAGEKSEGSRFAEQILRLAVIFLAATLGFLGAVYFECNQAIAATPNRDLSEEDSLVKVFFGPKKVLFCFPSAYVTGVGQLSDGSWRAEIVMFLPDLSTEKVYDKLHPIPPSPIFWSPERIAYSHSILQIEVTSSYLGPSDPTGEISFNQGTKNIEQGDSLSNQFPVDGFNEYEDKLGYSLLYVYKGAEPYGITCYAQFCSLDEILNHSLLVDISLDKSAIPKALVILSKFNHIVNSRKCR